MSAPPPSGERPPAHHQSPPSNPAIANQVLHPVQQAYLDAIAANSQPFANFQFAVPGQLYPGGPPIPGLPQQLAPQQEPPQAVHNTTPQQQQGPAMAGHSQPQQFPANPPASLPTAQINGYVPQHRQLPVIPPFGMNPVFDAPAFGAPFDPYAIARLQAANMTQQQMQLYQQLYNNGAPGVYPHMPYGQMFAWRFLWYPQAFPAYQIIAYGGFAGYPAQGQPQPQRPPPQPAPTPSAPPTNAAPPQHVNADPQPAANAANTGPPATAPAAIQIQRLPTEKCMDILHSNFI